MPAPEPFDPSHIQNATDEEINGLRHVVDKLPRKVWISLLVSGAERFTFYVVSTPWQNYMQNGSDDSALPGALGLGQAHATAIFNAFYFYSFLAPVPFAVVSDTCLGRYKLICISLSLYVCGTMIQFITSLPSVFSHNTGLAGLLVGMVFIGAAVGGTKAAIVPFIGDQYPVKPPQVKILPTGERVVVDRDLTLQYVYNVFYWITNIAALSLLAATYLEKYRGFWTANLLALSTSWIGLALLIVFSNEFEKPPPQGDVLIKSGSVIKIALQNKFNLDAARPRFQQENYHRAVPWSERFVTEIKCGLVACQVMAWFILFYLGLNQITNNLVSQAGQMVLGGFPNDGIQVLNGVACVVLGPIMQKVLYPVLATFHIPFGPLVRMSLAFFVMGAAFAYAAGLQKMIYNSGPCYEAPLSCTAAQREGEPPLPNSITVWMQTPIYAILAISEILGFVSLSEYSYSNSPKDMRTVLQSIQQLSAGIGSAIGIALGPVSQNPKVIWTYVGLAASLACTSPLFWIVMGHPEKHIGDVSMVPLENA
ncbi:hypothetical protein QQS21_010946 [Conoideocrella luteorostrata]|uniref:Oligopeptide transporter n=1 Tax=Conoideocrella luteorostrata TaxID=1105319 RepID=A0AAJ0CE77_9HYPO|nr:hypothetical protein QQS21_010946 [Conoideocrella luteorostrata]